MTTETAEAQVLELTPINQSTTSGALAPQQRGALAIADTSPVAVMLAALERGAAPETIEKMMDLQERWEGNEARKAYFVAVAAFKAKNLRIVKNTEFAAGPLSGRKYANLAAWVGAVTGALSDCGLSAAWRPVDPIQDRSWIRIRCTLTHSLGYSEHVEFEGPPDTSGAKNPLQARASTAKYLERYTLEMILGLTADDGDDDDGNGGPNKQREQSPARAAPAAAEKPRTYPADRFDKNLPEWRELIATGAKTADQIIKMVNSKGAPLTEEQAAAIREPAAAPAPAAGKPRMTFAQVADHLAKAKNAEELDTAASLISAVANKQHRTELNTQYEKRRDSFNPA